MKVIVVKDEPEASTGLIPWLMDLFARSDTGLMVLFVTLVLAAVGWAFKEAFRSYISRIVSQLQRRKIEHSPTTLPSPEKPTASQFEIESYWGYRPHAHSEMREYLYNADHRIFAAGGALTTLLNSFNDPEFVSSLAKRINKNPEFQFTLIMDFENRFSTSEDGRKKRASKISSSKRTIEAFLAALDEKVSPKISRPLVEFKKYNEKVTPRHFLLAADETIFIGSYLSHKEGQYSYLLKIRDKEDAILFPLMENEIEYVKRSSSPYELGS